MDNHPLLDHNLGQRRAETGSETIVLKEYRLNRRCHLLKNTTFTLSEINGLKVSDVSNFTRGVSVKV